MPGPYGSVGVDYRQLQGPAEVDTNLPDSGAAARAAELGQTFREFEGITGDIANKAETQAGALAGAAAGATGHPQYRQGLERFTAYSQAFNNAATGAYAVEAQAQADDTAARLRVQANGNPATFQTTYAAVRDGVLKQAPAMAVPMLTELYNQRLAEGLAAISGEQATQQRDTQRQMYQLGIQRQTSRVAILQGSADPHDQLKALDEQAKLSAQITGGVNTGLFSKAEGEAMSNNAMRQVTSEVFETQVDRELADPKGDVITLLSRFRDAHIANISDPKQVPILSEDEFNKLMMDAKQKIIQSRMADELAREQGRTAQQARFLAGDQKDTALALSGQLTFKQLAADVDSGNILPATARSVRGIMMNRQEQPKSNATSLRNLYTGPDFLGMSDHDIIAYGDSNGINAADQLKAINERDRRNNTWEGTQSAKDARAVILNALKLPKGPALLYSANQQKAASDALVDFTGRMNKVDAAHRETQAMSVAQAVVGDENRKIVSQEVTELQGSMSRLQQAHGPGSSDPWSSDTMNAAVQKVQQQIQSLQRQVGGTK